MVEVTTNVRKFPITALGEIAADGVVCGPVLGGTLLAPTQGLQFQALYPLSFLFILVQTLYRARGSHEYAQISNDVATRNCSERTYLQARTRRCAFGTDAGFTFSVTPSP